MNDQVQQQPIMLTERQAFEMVLRALKAGSYPGDKAVDVATAIIFCERVIASSDPGVLTASATSAETVKDQAND